MQQKFTDLRCKEIINICDGCRLGYVIDVELELPGGRVVALIAPGPRRFFGLFGKECDYRIPWQCIRRIGEDLILVDVCLDQIRMPLEKHGFFC